VVLLRGVVDDYSSESTSTSIFEAVSPDAKTNISAICLHPGGEVVFCGKADGSICLYDLKTGDQLRMLYSHKSLVRIVTWMSQHDIILSVDASNGIFAWNLRKTQEVGWVTGTMAFQSRLGCGKSIIQVLMSETIDKFVLSTRESDHLWSIHGHQEQSLLYPKTPGVRKWIQHQRSPLHIICIEGTNVRTYSWNDFSEVASVPIPMSSQALQLKSVNLYASKRTTGILLELSELDGSAATCSVRFLDSSSFDVAENKAKEGRAEAAGDYTENSPQCATNEATAANLLFSTQFAVLDPYIAHVVGFGDNGKLIFLDTSSWVCSLDLENLGTTSVSYVRHFFVPYDWFSGTREVICAIAKRDVLFAKHEDIAIVRGGLEHVENVHSIEYSQDGGEKVEAGK
jgi:WD40 repeat protein